MIEEYIVGLKNEINELKIENWNLKYAHREFTWAYIYNQTELITLEDLVKWYPEVWCNCLVEAFRFWDRCCLYEIIAEATDDFEERLHMMKINVSFNEVTEVPCNYSILVGQFIGESDKEMESLVDKNNELQVKNDRLRAENGRLRKKIGKIFK